MNASKMVRSIRSFALLGAVFGVALAALSMVLVEFRPFPVPMDGFIERLTFKLCPLYILVFSSIGWTEMIAVVLFSNALLYATGFALLGVAVSFFRRVDV